MELLAIRCPIIFFSVNGFLMQEYLSVNVYIKRMCALCGQYNGIQLICRKGLTSSWAGNKYLKCLNSRCRSKTGLDHYPTEEERGKNVLVAKFISSYYISWLWLCPFASGQTKDSELCGAFINLTSKPFFLPASCEEVSAFYEPVGLAEMVASNHFWSKPHFTIHIVAYSFLLAVIVGLRELLFFNMLSQADSILSFLFSQWCGYAKRKWKTLRLSNRSFNWIKNRKKLLLPQQSLQTMAMDWTVTAAAEYILKKEYSTIFIIIGKDCQTKC